MLLRNLAALGTVSVCQLHAEELPPLEELDPAQCYLSWTVELASSCPEEELREVFEFVEHLAEVTVQRVDQPSQAENGLALHRPSVQPRTLDVVPAAVPEKAEPSRRAEKRKNGEKRRSGERRKSPALRQSRVPSGWQRTKSTG